MEVTFLGVGEAFDEHYPNTSVLVRTEAKGRQVTLLLDCGYSVPPRFWRQGFHVESLDAIWISHFHADHAFGLPALLVRFWEEKRKGVLNILGQKGIEPFVRSCLDLAYPRFNQRNAHALQFTEVEPGEVVRVLDLSWSTAVTDHSQKNLALRVDSGDKSLFYSGDGGPTVDSIALANKVQLVIHEAFQLSAEVPGHGTVGACLEMAKVCGTSRLALVHLQRRVRQEQLGEIKRLAASIEDLEVVVPEPGDRLRI